MDGLPGRVGGTHPTRGAQQCIPRSSVVSAVKKRIVKVLGDI